MAPLISIIIPNRNGEATIGLCLEAAFNSAYPQFEVIVVDDHSEDGSTAVIERFPSRLVRLDSHRGAGAARNAGAAASSGELLFFTDADCLLQPETLAVAAAACLRYGPDVIVGGTYTPDPYDADFFSRFQSLFVHYSETKHADAADYAAGHALVIAAERFRDSGGFVEGYLPVAEDVDFSHRLRRAGYRIVIEPGLQVQHVFGFSLTRSLRNAAYKSMHWTVYSIRNRDVFADSGTASTELKVNVVLSAAALVLLFLSLAQGDLRLLLLSALALGADLIVARDLITAFFRGGGTGFGIAATAYYLLPFPLAVGMGVVAGLLRYLAPSAHLQRGS